LGPTWSALSLPRQNWKPADSKLGPSKNNCLRCGLSLGRPFLARGMLSDYSLSRIIGHDDTSTTTSMVFLFSIDLLAVSLATFAYDGQSTFAADTNQNSLKAMSKEEFKTLFEHALETAARNAEKELGRAVPRQFEIEMGGLAPHSRIMSKEAILEEIYLGPDQFYRIIDISVCRVSKDVSTVYMVVSGHTPGPLNRTWNQPSGSGPFKQVLADKVELI